MTKNTASGPIQIVRCGQAPFTQTIGTLLRFPWQAKVANKIDSPKSQFDEPCVDHFMKLYRKFVYLLSDSIMTMEQHTKKCKQLFKYQHLLLLRDIWLSKF
jgi:hypothetical protein